MRLGIFAFVCLYCVWQIESSEMTTSSRVRVSREEKHEEKISTSGRDKEEYLYPPPLVAPYGGTIKFLVGIAVPISMGDGRILSFGQNFQFQYALPQNATFFTNFLADSASRESSRAAMQSSTRSMQRLRRRRRNQDAIPDNTRSIFYRSLELTYDRWGENGKICVLRSICDAAAAPLEGEGLVGELLHLALTPNYGRARGLDTPDDEDDYLRAARAGRSEDNCSLIYPGCPEGAGLLDRISMLHYPI